MAIPYEDLLPEIIPMVPGCSDTLIENAIRSSVVELCEKAETYQVELDPISTVSGLYEYELDPPANTSIHRILCITYKGIDLEPLNSQLLEQRLPKWRTSTSDSPEFYIKQSSTIIWIAPIPSATEANSMIVRAILRPSHTSTTCDTDIMNDYRDTIVNGAIHRLLRTPNKDWTDMGAAAVFGSLFLEGIKQATEKARSADSGIARKVNYGGIHASRRLRRRNYGTYKTRN